MMDTIESVLSFVPDDGYGCIYMYETCGKKYVGQTRLRMSERHTLHITGKKQQIDRILRKYPYTLKILYIGLIEYLNDLEIYFIKKYNTMFPNGWNFTSGGGQPTEISEITKKKIGEASKKHWEDEEYRRKKIESATGRVFSEQTCKKISMALKRKYENDPEYRQRMIEINNHRKMTPEARKHMSEAAIRRFSNPEERRKQSERRKGIKTHPCSEETKRKISKANKGRKHTEESRRHMSEAHKRKTEVQL